MLNRYTKPERQRIPCVGKVRLGIKVDYTNPKTGRKSQIPRATDYFVIKGESEAEKQLNVLLGEKPKEIKIYFPFLHTGGGSSPEQWYGDWIERVFPVHYKAYSGSTKTKEGQLLLKASDNEAIIKTPEFYKKVFGKEPPEDEKPPYRITFSDGKTFEDIPEFKKLLEDGIIKPTGILNFNVVGLDTAGCFQLTCRDIAIQNVVNYLNSLKSTLGFPFCVETIMKLEEVTISPGGEKKVVRVVNFERSPTWQDTIKQISGEFSQKKQIASKIIDSLYGAGDKPMLIEKPPEPLELEDDETLEHDEKAVVDIVEEKEEASEEPPELITGDQLKQIQATCNNLGISYTYVKDICNVESLARGKCSYKDALRVLAWLDEKAQEGQPENKATIADAEKAFGTLAQKPDEKPQSDEAYIQEKLEVCAEVINEHNVAKDVVDKLKERHGLSGKEAVTIEKVEGFFGNLCDYVEKNISN